MTQEQLMEKLRWKGIPSMSRQKMIDYRRNGLLQEPRADGFLAYPLSAVADFMASYAVMGSGRIQRVQGAAARATAIEWMEELQAYVAGRNETLPSAELPYSEWVMALSRDTTPTPQALRPWFVLQKRDPLAYVWLTEFLRHYTDLGDDARDVSFILVADKETRSLQVAVNFEELRPSGGTRSKMVAVRVEDMLRGLSKRRCMHND